MSIVTPKFFYSTDASAPQITSNQPQTVLDVLKACLVGSAGTAYGATPSCAWTIPFEDTSGHALTLQQGSGSSRVLRLGDPTIVSDGDPDSCMSYFEARMYDSMTDVNTGTNPVPTTSQQSTWWWVYATQTTGFSATAATIPWRLVATDRFFYLMFWNGVSGWSAYFSAVGYFFGDIFSYNSTDTNQTIISGYTNNSVNTAGSPIVSTVSQWEFFVPFKGSNSNTSIDNTSYIRSETPVGAYGPVPCQVTYGYTMGSSGDLPGSVSLTNIPSPSLSGSFLFQQVYVMTNTTAYNLRGEMPGLVYPMHGNPFPDLYTFTMASDSWTVWVQSPDGSVPSSVIAINSSGWNQN